MNLEEKGETGARVIYHDEEIKYLHRFLKTLPENILVGDIHIFLA
jgi:hypothetical protein